MELVAAEKPRLPADKAAIERVKQRIVEAYPDLRFPIFLNMGVPAEWRRQARLTEGSAP